MTPRAPEARVFLDNEIIVDSFAGGGGASLGIHWALGRGPDIAINHDAEAIALHKANHPESKHYVEDVWRVDPAEACQGRPVGLMWLSPDCKHFSKAKGGKPVNKKVRGLAWVAIRWATAVKPRIIVLENVEEFQTWGPVLPDGRPCPKRKGQTFRAFVRKLERLGYVVEWKELRANHYLIPTIRKRLFMIARRDGRPIVWPVSGGQINAQYHHLWQHRETAADCVEWSLPCPSIFERKKPLAENTMRRIARGIDRFVINSPRPFIVNNLTNNVPRGVDEPMTTILSGNHKYLARPFIAGVGGRQGQSPERDIEKPYQTITAKGDAALVVPHITKFHSGSTGSDIQDPMPTVTSNGDNAARPGCAIPLGLASAYIVPTAHHGDDRAHSIEDPLRTICGGKRGDHAIVSPILIGAGGPSRQGEARTVDDPARTVLPDNNQYLVAPTLIQTGYGEDKHRNNGDGQPPRILDLHKPLGTVVADGTKHALVSSFLAKHNAGNEATGQTPDDPMHTITAKDTKAVVTAHIARHYSDQGQRPGSAMDEALSTVTPHDHHSLVTSHLSAFYTSNTRGGQGDLFAPMKTITAEGNHIAEVRSFLVAYFGNEKDGQELNDPMRTVTAKQRFGLVNIMGTDYIIADIGMRMLQPRELYRAQGFPDTYRIDVDYNGKPMTKTAQVRMCGNSVCPPLAAAIIRANYVENAAGERVA